MQTMLLESSFLLAVQTPGLSCEAPTRGVELPSLPTKYRTVIFRQKKTKSHMYFNPDEST